MLGVVFFLATVDRLSDVVTRRPANRPATPLDLERLSLDSFRGRPVAVLGLARSGIALARFLADRGAQVTVYDARPPDRAGAADRGPRGAPRDASPRPRRGPGGRCSRARPWCAPRRRSSSRFPTTEPRLRAALAALEAAGRVPVVSEVDLFLRLCPAPTVGVTGHEGQDHDERSLCAAVLAAGSAPVLLGGNIGTPLVERLPELTRRPAGRARALRAAAADALAGHRRWRSTPTSRRTTSTATARVAAYRAVKRRLAELVDPDGALVLNAEDPVGRRLRRPGDGAG